MTNYKTDNGVLFNLDCLDFMSSIPDKSIDMILCDLPFSITQNKWDIIIPFDKLWLQYDRIIKDNGAIVLFGSQPFTSLLITSNLKLFRYEWIWSKSHSVGFLNVKKMPMRSHENICIFYKKLPIYNPQIKDKLKKNIRSNSKTNLSSNYGHFNEGNYRTIPENKTYPKSILNFDSTNRNSILHPTQKPLLLFEYLIKTYTNEGDVVLDNCSGSGTSVIASINTNRKYICIEKDKDYYDLSVNRINHRLEYGTDTYKKPKINNIKEI